MTSWEALEEPLDSYAHVEFRWPGTHPDGCLDGQIGRTIRLAGTVGQAAIVSVRYHDGDAWATFEIGSIADDLSPDAQVVEHD